MSMACCECQRASILYYIVSLLIVKFSANRILFQDTPDERTVYLGPWEVVGSEQRRVLWQCSYQNECLEHYRMF